MGPRSIYRWYSLALVYVLSAIILSSSLVYGVYIGLVMRAGWGSRVQEWVMTIKAKKHIPIINDVPSLFLFLCCSLQCITTSEYNQLIPAGEPLKRNRYLTSLSTFPVHCRWSGIMGNRQIQISRDSPLHHAFFFQNIPIQKSSFLNLNLANLNFMAPSVR